MKTNLIAFLIGAACIGTLIGAAIYFAPVNTHPVFKADENGVYKWQAR